MLFSPFSLKNVLMGVFLGFVIVAGWFFYPDIKSAFESAFAAVHQKIMNPAQGQKNTVFVSQVQESQAKNNIHLKSNREQPLVEIEKEPNSLLATEESKDIAVTAEALKEPAPSTYAPVKKTEPIYSQEESRWQALFRKPLNPEFVNDYPYGECFRTSAAENRLPVALVLGLAGYLSNYDPESVIDGRFGIMHLGWPDPARQAGIENQDVLVDDPCTNISVACSFLAKLLSFSNGKWVPVLVAFRDQAGMVHPEKINSADLNYSYKLRKYVENVFKGSFEKKTLYAFWEFDRRTTAVSFMADIEHRSGVDLCLSQIGYQYVINIPAASEKEKMEKVEIIKKETGLTERNRRPL